MKHVTIENHLEKIIGRKLPKWALAFCHCMGQQDALAGQMNWSDHLSDHYAALA